VLTVRCTVPTSAEFRLSILPYFTPAICGVWYFVFIPQFATVEIA
jgi:hypothetical protein